MRFVAKGPAPADFDAWKAATTNQWTPGYADLRNPLKARLHDALLAEQGWTCCYCGRDIAQDDSHIEHFRPQASHPALALEFDNLHASCIRANQPGTPLHCGHAKGNAFDEALAISPCDSAVEQRFLYGLNGAILPAEASDPATRYMSTTLRLDESLLRNRRERAIREVFDALFLETATEDELRRLMAAFRLPNPAGQLPSFGHVVARYAEQLVRSMDASGTDRS
jgi:uncharacterized protein (TIGR02646 family)